MVAVEEGIVSSLNKDALTSYVLKQVSNFFPDGYEMNNTAVREAVESAMRRYAVCASGINLKYYLSDGRPVFNHVNSDQYATLLYYLSNEFYRMEAHEEATRIYYLNKALHAMDVFYAVELPEIFLLSHPVGTVLGRASYSNYFAAYQGCTVGANNNDGNYPVLGEGVVLYKSSAVLGKLKVGNNVIFSAHSLVKETNVPSDSVVFGETPHNVVKPLKSDVKQRVFMHP